MGERPRRIVEEHHPETREQDVEGALRPLGLNVISAPPRSFFQKFPTIFV